jgi:Aspartyl/Asparaginyl beta-hydroxylase
VENFLCVTTGLDVLPLLYAVSRMPHLWDMDTTRTTFPGTPHFEVSDILLRFQETAGVKSEDVPTLNDVHECVAHPAWFLLPEARPLVFGLMARVQATRLGRCMITKLRPGCKILPHTDAPVQTSYWLRHHITLCGPPECVFQVGDEALALIPGSCFRVDNSKEHSVCNDGNTERITLIVDLHCD